MAGGAIIRLYNGHVAQGEWMVYRRMHLRTDPGRPLTVTLGVQCASQIGGLRRITATVR